MSELPATVETSRLWLELLTASDAADVSARHRQADWHPEFPRPDDCDAASMVIASGPPSSWGPRRIRRRTDRLVIGTIGFMAPPEVVADRVEMAEVGYGLVPAARGAGLATEALHGLLVPVDALGVRVCAHVDVENGASIKVLQNCGFALLASRGDDMPSTLEYRR